MYANMMTVGGVDVYTAARFVVENVEGLDPWPEIQRDLLTVPGYDGARVAPIRSRVSPRRIRVTGTIMLAGLTLTTQLDALADLLERDDLVLQFPSRRSGVNYTANLEGPRGIVAPVRSMNPECVKLDFTFLCAQPYGVDASPSAVTGVAANTTTPCNVGTAPSDVVCVIHASATTPALIHANSAGVEIGRIELLSISGSQKYRIDTANGGYVEVDLGAGYVNGMNFITNTNYRFPDLQPKYGVRSLAQYQTLKSTTGTLDVSFYRRWR